MATQPPRTPRPARTARVRVRRNVRWLAAGIIAVAIGGLGTWALFSTVADTRSAIKVTSTVYRGQIIQANNLTVVSIGRNTDVPVVSGDSLNAVVGQAAHTDLPAGVLLVDKSYGAPALADGMARVGLKIGAGRIPTTGLKPGTSVAVVAVPAANASASEVPKTVMGTLASAPTVAVDGSYLVDLEVGVTDAEQVARLGAQGQVALIERAAP
jgi:hypothetical protein